MPLCMARMVAFTGRVMASFWSTNIEHPWSVSLNTGSSGMFRFDPRRYHISYHADNSPNPHGISFDQWGYHYATDGTGGEPIGCAEKGVQMQKLLEMQVRVPANGVISSQRSPRTTREGS